MSNDKDFKVKNGIQPAVYQEGLGTVATGSVTVGYDLSVAAYDSKFGDTSSQTNEISGIYIKPDGTKMYVSDIDTDRVYQYSLSTAWDASTASYDSKSFSTLSQHGYPNGIYFKSDGTKFYMIDSATSVYQYSLSTAWDVSTASYDSVSYNYDNDVNISGRDIFFKSDGLRMYLLGTGNYDILSYTLSTAWDLSTASFDGTSACLDITTTVDSAPTGLYISDDGYALFIMGSTGDAVYKIALSTAWDVSTGDTGSETSFSVSSQMTYPNGMTMGDSGTKLYALNSASGTSEGVYQYSTGSTLTTNTLDLSTGNAFQITPTSNIQVGLSNPAASGTVSQATLLLDGAVNGYDLSGAAYDSVSFSVSSQDSSTWGFTFNNDGTKAYTVGTASDTVYQYSLSTGFDLSTISYDSVSFSVAGQETAPRKVRFNSDGTKMYVAGNAANTIFQYSLSTGFDIGTASYDSVSFSVSSQAPITMSMAFNPSGTKMYVLDYNVAKVHQYSLSTGFDLSTASYDTVEFSVDPQDSTPLGLEFKPDGTKFYIVGTGSDTVHQYSLSTAFDLSTASYDSVSFSVFSQANTPADVVFNSSGNKMYIHDDATDSVYQYTTGSAYTVTYDTTLQWGGGTAPDSPLANETDVLTFSTRDGGTTYQAAQAIDGAK